MTTSSHSKKTTYVALRKKLANEGIAPLGPRWRLGLVWGARNRGVRRSSEGRVCQFSFRIGG
jgi:hypothetical protein